MLEELQRRNFASTTIRGYIRTVRDFAAYFHKPPDQLGAEELRQFQLHMLRDQKLATGTVQNRMTALRFFFKKVLKRHDPEFDDMGLTRRPKKLPVVLSPTSAPPQTGGIGFRAGFDARGDATRAFSVVRS
jgi:site-specific recombinase XerD